MRTETDCRQPGRRYLEKQKKRRKRRKVLLLCFLSMAVIAGIFLIAAEEKRKAGADSGASSGGLCVGTGRVSAGSISDAGGNKKVGDSKSPGCSDCG